MKVTAKKKVLFIVLLAAVVCCPLVSKLAPFSRWSDISALIWLFATLELVCRFRTKKEHLLSGAFFTVGISLLDFGVLGNPWLSIVPVAILGVILFAGFCFSAFVMRKWDCLLATLVLPVIWLLGYFLATVLRVPGAFRLDMLFSNLTVLLQAERLIGPAGLTFVILWGISILRYATEHRGSWSAWVCTGLFFLLLLPGMVFLSSNTEPGQFVRVAYTTGPYGGGIQDYVAPAQAVNEQSLENAFLNASQQNAEILVFTEEAFEMTDKDASSFLARCSELAKENAIAVLLGLDVKDTDNSEGGKALNQVVLIDSSGSILDTYRKHCLIPLIESDYVKGDGVISSHTLEINGKSVRISCLICYDSNFPGYVRNVDADTDILFLPSWDWSAVTEFHAKLCRAIAIGNHLCVLKPTYDGLSIAYDPYGEVIHASSTDTSGFEQVHIVEMPLATSYTVTGPTATQSPLIYAIIGTEILSACFCLLLLIVSRLRRKEKTKRSFWFNILIETTFAGCLADALSWLLDGCTRLITVLFVSTALSMLLTIVLFGLFIAYISEYIKERDSITWNPVVVSWTYMIVVATLTMVAIFTGNLFTFENGVYQDGPLYSLYVFFNAGSMLLGMIVALINKRALDFLDRAITYSFMIIPILTAAVNIFVEDWSFAYPAITLVLVLLYIMLQTDKMERLISEGQIVSYHATHDDLTGLNNRRAFTSRVDTLKETAGNSGIVFGDLNVLKYANDNFGHEAGDQLLIRYTGILSGIFRKSEIFRISGDEFICMLENMPEKVFTERVRALKDILGQDGRPLACIGTAYGANHETSELIKKAELMMYAEKEIFHARFPEFSRSPGQ